MWFVDHWVAVVACQLCLLLSAVGVVVVSACSYVCYVDVAVACVRCC